MRTLSPGHGLILLAALAGADAARAQTSAFLCIDGVAGNETAPGVVGCSRLASGDVNAFLEGNSPTLREIRVEKVIDSASNPLLRAMVQGTTFNTVRIRIRNGNGFETVTYRLLNTRVTSFGQRTRDGEQEAWTAVAFAPVRLETRQQFQDPVTGEPGPANFTCWNLGNGTITTSACP
jgi:hypothetical protein